MAKMRLGVLISGRGSNLQALIDACAGPDYPAEIALVVSNRPNAAGLARAQAAGIATRAIDHKTFAERQDFETAVDAALREARVELICLAGFMRLLSPAFVEPWRSRILNIHPTLLPAFPGLDVHARMVEAGVKVAGCTVHVVTAEMDDGPIVGQAALAVRPDDTAETLAARILELEHQLYPACVQMFAEGRAQVRAGRVVIDAHADGAIVNPPTGA